MSINYKEDPPSIKRGTRVLKFKDIAPGKALGLIHSKEGSYFWRFRDAIRHRDHDYPRKRFHSMGSFEKFVKSHFK